MRYLGLRLFVSYSSKDRQWVRTHLVPQMEKRGFRVIVDDQDFRIGTPALVNMERAVEESDATILVLTPEWLESIWTDFESLVAQWADPVGARARLVPIMLRDCAAPSRLDMLTYADFRVKSRWPHEFSRLASQLPSMLIRHGREVIRLADFKQIFRSTTMIDRVCFGERPHYLEVDPASPLALTWIEVEPDIYTLLVDRQGHTRGYMNAMLVEQDLFAKIFRGRVQDNSLPASSIVPFGCARSTKLYIMSIAVLPHVRRSVGLFSECIIGILNGFLNKLIYYARSCSLKVDELVAVAWTETGLRLCETLGMSRVCSDRFGNPVYFLDLRSGVGRSGLTRRLPALGTLMKTYERLGH